MIDAILAHGPRVLRDSRQEEWPLRVDPPQTRLSDRSHVEDGPRHRREAGLEASGGRRDLIKCLARTNKRSSKVANVSPALVSSVGNATVFVPCA